MNGDTTLPGGVDGRGSRNDGGGLEVEKLVAQGVRSFARHGGPAWRRLGGRK